MSSEAPALLHVARQECPDLVVSFECAHGMAGEPFTQVTPEQILDIQLALYEAMLVHALEAKKDIGLN